MVQKVVDALELLVDDWGALNVSVALQIAEGHAAHIFPLRVVLDLFQKDKFFQVRVEHILLTIAQLFYISKRLAP